MKRFELKEAGDKKMELQVKKTSLIKSLKVVDFMSFQEGCVEFDDTNILTLKGYNNSGKSALVKAFEVCLLGKYENKQVGFIRDGADRFHIEVEFTDGVKIVREKLANGQSLYEMHKNGELVFTTRQGRTYGKVNGVPEVIQQYVGATQMEEDWLNSASGNEPLLLTDTTGGENFRAISDVLKAEELHKGLTAVRQDMKTTQEEVNYLRARQERVNDELGGLPEKGILNGLQVALEVGNESVRKGIALCERVESVRGVGASASAVLVAPPIRRLDGRLAGLVASTLVRGQNAVGVRSAGVKKVDTAFVEILGAVRSCFVLLDSLREAGGRADFNVEVPVVRVQRDLVEVLNRLYGIGKELLVVLHEVKETESKAAEVGRDIKEIMDTLGEENLFKCSHCGKLSLNAMDC